MKKILILTLVLGIGLGALPEAFGQAAAKPKSGTTKAQMEANKQQKRAELETQYGMTFSQIQQYETLQAARDKKVAEIRKIPGLSQKARVQKTEAARAEFQTALDKILTPAQREAFAKEREHKEGEDVQVKQIFQDYNNEKAALEPLRTTQPDNYKASVAQLKKRYEVKLSVLVGEDKAHWLMLQKQHKRNALSPVAKQYALSYADAQSCKRLEIADKERRDRLANTTLTRLERIEKTKQLDAQRDAEFKALLGEEKFKQWQRKKYPTLNQMLKRNLELSDQQIAQYKEILNRQAIENVKIKKGKGSKQEQQAKTAQLKTDTDQQIRQILTPEQYSKMSANRQKFENTARRKAIQAHTIQPAPKSQQQSAK